MKINVICNVCGLRPELCGPNCTGGMLSSEPLCNITDDMTYQENIETLSGAIYDYGDVMDNQPSYFDDPCYYDPCDYEEWDTWDDLGEGGACGDPYRSDVTDGGTVFPRGWSGVRSDGAIVAPESTVIKTQTDHLRSRYPEIFSSRI